MSPRLGIFHLFHKAAGTQLVYYNNDNFPTETFRQDLYNVAANIFKTKTNLPSYLLIKCAINNWVMVLPTTEFTRQPSTWYCKTKMINIVHSGKLKLFKLKYTS